MNAVEQAMTELADRAIAAGAANEKESIVVWLLHSQTGRRKRLARELAGAVWNGEHHAWAEKIRS